MRRLGCLLLSALLFLSLGCQDDNDEPSVPPAPESGLSIAITSDTLWFVTGDPAATPMVVRLTDAAGEPVSGAYIGAFIAQPARGWLTYDDPDHGGTTDTNGQVYYTYHVADPGSDIIFAFADSLSAMEQVVSAHPYHGNTLFVDLVISPAEFDLSDDLTDTLHADVVVTVTDDLGPVPGLNVTFLAQHGWIDAAAPTDQAGSVETQWHYREGDYPHGVSELAVEVMAGIGIFMEWETILLRR